MTVVDLTFCSCRDTYVLSWLADIKRRKLKKIIINSDTNKFLLLYILDEELLDGNVFFISAHLIEMFFSIVID